MMSEKPEDIVITDACEVVAEFVQGDACQSPEGTADLPTSVNPVVAELSEEPAPIPPPRKESQFKDAITALQRAKSARAEPDTTGLRQGRDLTDEERRAVAEKRARWQQTGSIHAGNHEADSLSATRRDRDLNEEEKKRIAATRDAWKHDSTTADDVTVPPPRAVEMHAERDLTEEEKSRVSKLRAVWKRIDRGSDLTDSPTSTGMGYWSGVGHNKHPSRQLTEDDKRRIAETRAHWIRSDPWKQLFESAAPIPDRGLTDDEVRRISALRMEWKRLSEDERVAQVALFRPAFEHRREFATRAATSGSAQTNIPLPAQYVDTTNIDRLSDVDLQPPEASVIHVDHDASMMTVHSLYDDTTGVLGRPLEIDTRPISSPRAAQRPAPSAPNDAECCKCVIM